MKRICFLLIGCVIASASAHAGEPGVKQTIAYVQKLQTNTGGFLSQAPQPNIRIAPTLRATSAGVRALKYLGAELPNKEACIKYVESCHDAETGGFGDMPKGKPDVFTTAVGLMAVTELKLPTEKYAKGAVKYLSDNAKTFDDIRIAVAGLERLKMKSAKNFEWLKEVKQGMSEDASFGTGPGQARETASRVVTLLRLGRVPDADNSILKILSAGQRQNGGWGKADNEIASDLETTYRVMRCYHMLKGKPGNVEGVRSFVAKCRNADGGYGIAPGQTSTIAGTYFAAIILHWLKESN